SACRSSSPGRASSTSSCLRRTRAASAASSSSRASPSSCSSTAPGASPRPPSLRLCTRAVRPPAGVGDGLKLPFRERLALDAMLAAELQAMPAADRPAFMAEFGIENPASDEVLHAIYRAVGLRSFFTVGEDEVRAWTIKAGDDAITAASKIHSDLAKGFVRAEVCAYDALVAAGGMKELKEKNGLRLEPKDYVVEDGDIVHIRSAV